MARSKKPTKGQLVIERALGIASLGDRWFLSLAGELGKLGGFKPANGEDSAPASTRPRSSRREVSRSPSSSPASSAPAHSPSKPRRPRLDLVCADDANSWDPLASGARVRAEIDPVDADHQVVAEDAAEHGAGVLPLLNALAQIVAEHPDKDYTALEQDERFWTLVQLLQSLGPPGLTAALPSLRRERRGS